MLPARVLPPIPAAVTTHPAAVPVHLTALPAEATAQEEAADIHQEAIAEAIIPAVEGQAIAEEGKQQDIT